MVSYQEARVKLTNTQLNKLSDGKSNTETGLRLNKTHFEDEELPHEFVLTKRQTTKIRNDYANNMLTNIKLVKAKISKIIQSWGSIGSC